MWGTCCSGLDRSLGLMHVSRYSITLLKMQQTRQTNQGVHPSCMVTHHYPVCLLTMAHLSQRHTSFLQRPPQTSFLRLPDAVGAELHLDLQPVWALLEYRAAHTNGAFSSSPAVTLIRMIAHFDNCNQYKWQPSDGDVWGALGWIGQCGKAGKVTLICPPSTFLHLFKVHACLQTFTALDLFVCLHFIDSALEIINLQA